MASRVGTVLVSGVVMLSLGACGGTEAPPAESAPTSESAAESHEGHAAGASRVFFVRPKNG